MIQCSMTFQKMGHDYGRSNQKQVLVGDFDFENFLARLGRNMSAKKTDLRVTIKRCA